MFSSSLDECLHGLGMRILWAGKQSGILRIGKSTAKQHAVRSSGNIHRILWPDAMHRGVRIQGLSVILPADVHDMASGGPHQCACVFREPCLRTRLCAALLCGMLLGNCLLLERQLGDFVCYPQRLQCARAYASFASLKLVGLKLEPDCIYIFDFIFHATSESSRFRVLSLKSGVHCFVLL